MKQILREISEHYLKANQDDRKMSVYMQFKQHPGWEIHKELLYLIRGKLAEEMLSERFTKLDRLEKDARQRAFAYTDEVIRFLINPLEKALKKTEFRNAFERKIREATATGATR